MARGEPTGVPDTTPAPGLGPPSGGLRVGEFRALWIAQVLSVAGDQLARVALTLLVYSRTHSALLAAVTFVASVVPTFMGGLTLSGLADSLPRRQVMIACDLSRAALVAVMALPGMPLGVLVGLLFAGHSHQRAVHVGTRGTVSRDPVRGQVRPRNGRDADHDQFAQVVGFRRRRTGWSLRRPYVPRRGCRHIRHVSGHYPGWWVHGPPPRGSPRAPLTGVMVGCPAGVRGSGAAHPMLLGWLAAFYNVPRACAAPLGKTLGGGASR